MVQIFATFANRVGAPEEFELVHAWDEWCRDGWEEGYHSSKKAALDALGADLFHHATIVIEIPYEAVRDAVNPPTKTVEGTVL